MALPILTPVLTTSVSVLPATGTIANVAAALPFQVYSTDQYFLSGAADQVAYVYHHLGGDVLDVELKEAQVYAAYEEATLEYSYLVNMHQATNVLSNVLGTATGTFDQKGEMLSGESVTLKYPRFDMAYLRRIANGISAEVGIGADAVVYSCSFDVVDGQQDYDLQGVIMNASADPTNSLYGVIPAGSARTKAIIRRIYYQTPRTIWRFYGYYGGINVVGNLSTYGQFADDSTFEVIPTWHNKLQAQMYKDSINTRLSHYSYELKNNKVRIFPIPYIGSGISKFWFEFSPQQGAYDESAAVGGSASTDGASGVSSLSNIPFANLPFMNVNSIGKHWIRRYALAIAKEMLAAIRGKFDSIPIPGNDLRMNASSLLEQAKEEKDKLKEELGKTLDQLLYTNMAKKDAEMLESSLSAVSKIPTSIMVG